ncbi:MAG TPA: glycoside hydrolase family 2 TIM barrel-domain containing protein [Chloroflexota bacterium]
MRATISLDGIWEARLDAEPSFGRRLPVPMPWQAADPALRDYAGRLWYRREFELPSQWVGQSIALRFGAVDYEARVWVNGQEVGGHVGGYTPFELDVTAQTRAGRNELSLRVDDPADVGELPHGKQGGRWYTPVSGPWQSVALLARPPRRVERVEIRPDARRGAVQARLAAVGLDGPTPLTVEVVDRGRVVASAQALAAPGIEPLVELTLAEPRLWSPDDPHLYALRARLGDDRLEARFGLRSVEARDGQILLNGQPLYLRGALDQAYWPETLYTLPSDEQIEREIRLARELGLNLLRKHIKPEDPRYLDACDRLGMLIWAEPANPDRFTERARAALRRDLLEMVERDYNRPSVIIWSLYNEDWGVPELFNDPEQQRWVAELYDELRRRDPSRLICDNSGWAHVVTDLNDYHEYYAAPERIGRFRERLDALLADPSENFVLGRSSRGEPILISEFGNWGLADPALARERIRGEPAWFAYYEEGAENPSDRMKRVAGFEARFARLGLGELFGSPGQLCAFLQRRAARALKAQIDEMRARPRLRGYVVTELTDLEWEGNGFFDYWRQPKAFPAELAWANAPLALIARPERRGGWAGEPIVIGLHVANDTGRRVEGVVRWSLDEAGLSGELPAVVPARSSGALPEALRLIAPPVGHATLRLELVAAGVGLPGPTGRAPGADRARDPGQRQREG